MDNRNSATEYELNSAQLEAVTSTEGVVRVIAGAGSGKTGALSRRFAFLVNEVGILPGNILCVTFTNKAANEMRQRIHALTGDNDTGFVNTFHGFCVSVLQEDSNAVQYPRSFLVLDNSDIDAMLRIIYEERGLTLRDMTFARARDMIEIQKLKEHPDYYEDMITMSLEVLREKYMQATGTKDIIFYGYLYQQKKCFGLDYNDLLKFTLYIFQQDEEIRLKWQRRLEYIMIDEFQDIDSIQYQLMQVLCGYHGNLFVVGDPDQTIYTWRGADIRYLLDLEKDFPHLQTIMMMENYRSTPQILALANSLVECNQTRMEKDLISTLPEGEKVVCHYAKNSQEESGWIAGQIKRIHESGTAYGDITILYRAHYVTRVVEDELRREELPYSIYSGVRFYDRAEIKDALSYLRMIAYKDDLSFLRVANVPKRNLGERRMRFLQEHAEQEGASLYDTLCRFLEDPIFRGSKAGEFIKLVEYYGARTADMEISELLSALLDESGYEEALRTEGSQERLDNLAELKQSIYEYETTCGEEAMLEHYLDHVALFTNADTAEKKDSVRLMTVHTAKGLEFPNVFLCGLNEGIFPSRNVRTLPEMEEERRLAFVAVTRAERRLFLSGAEGRNIDGSPRFPSRFVLEVDQSLLDYDEPLEESLVREARSHIGRITKRLRQTADSDMFPEGTRVAHRIFGPGTIQEVDVQKHAYRILFDAIDTPRTIAGHVKLEVLD